MKPAPFDYLAPRSVAEACAALAESGGGATILAGGQTLMPLLALRMSQPFILIDLARIPELQGVTQAGGGVKVGAMTRQSAALESEMLARELPVLVEALRHVGHHQTRNRGTIGGSIALGEPAAEMPATAVALDASIEAHSVRGARRIQAREFYLGPYMTVLEPDELVTAIHYPAWPKGHLRVFRELAQRPGDFALSGIVGAIAAESGIVVRAGLAWFGMGPTPILARQAMDALMGKKLTEVDVSAVAEIAVTESAPFDDHHASAEYRRTVGKRVFARALQEALSPGEKCVSEHKIQLSINGRAESATVEARKSLGDFLRDIGYTGVHLGCEHGVCGACTVIVDGDAVRSCLMLAVQADGTTVTTVEGLAAADGTLHPVQQAMRDEHALQCGFCTPGIVSTLAALTAADKAPDEATLLAAMSGHICRCTGYQGIRRAVKRLAGEPS